MRRSHCRNDCSRLPRRAARELPRQQLDVRPALQLLRHALAPEVVRRDARRGEDAEHGALAADQLGQLACALHAVEHVVRADVAGRDLRVLQRGVNEHELDALVRRRLERRVEGGVVVRRDDDRVRLARDDAVHDRDLQRRVELARTLDVEIHAELLGLGLGTALDRLVEVVALRTADQRDPLLRDRPRARDRRHDERPRNQREQRRSPQTEPPPRMHSVLLSLDRDARDPAQPSRRARRRWSR